MFEGCLVESSPLPASITQRWTALTSIALQCGVAALLVVLPLLHPASLPIVAGAPRLVAPIPPPRPPKPVAQPQPASSASQAISAPAAAAPAAARILLPHPDGQPTGDAPTTLPDVRMGPAGAGVATGLGTMPTQPTVSVLPSRAPGRVTRPSGVVAGLLLAPIQPIYPPIAKAAGVQGTVVVEAVISKLGRIESLHAISGPPMLRPAALDAISAARYQPYMLDGEPTEVQTTITVVFRLGP